MWQRIFSTRYSQSYGSVFFCSCKNIHYKMNCSRYFSCIPMFASWGRKKWNSELSFTHRKIISAFWGDVSMIGVQDSGFYPIFRSSNHLSILASLCLKHRDARTNEYIKLKIWWWRINQKLITSEKW